MPTTDILTPKPSVSSRTESGLSALPLPKGGQSTTTRCRSGGPLACSRGRGQ